MHLMDTEMKKAKEFMSNHDCPLRGGMESKRTKEENWMLDGRFTLELGSTAIGTKFTVACACGQKCDVTDYDLW